jgi:peptidoglycan/xylan/chitin deacetylase (PgdA/CDA1 family)
VSGGASAAEEARAGAWGGLGSWLRARSGPYIARRARALLRRYGLTSAKAARRAEACADLVGEFGTAPVFMVPGRVVERRGAYFRALESRGVELGLHAYDHVDFRGLAPDAIRAQMTRAQRAFVSQGVGFDGFRCPYLGYTDAVPGATPAGLVRYSSNRAVWREEVSLDGSSETAVFRQLGGFYDAAPSSRALAVPRTGTAFIEIPCCVPDDIQLFDGLGLDEAGVAAAWTSVLDATHRRGEIFVVLFHPELFDRVGPVLEALLREARRRRPEVWLARLRDVREWWSERAAATWRAVPEGGGLRLEIEATDRLTVVARNLDLPGAEPWLPDVDVVPARSVLLPGHPRPLLGVAGDVPGETRAMLRDEGYLLEEADPGRCALTLDGETVGRLGDPVSIVEHVEGSGAPMVRLWRWPERAASALAVTGDLDAMSLGDYAGRFYRR